MPPINQSKRAALRAAAIVAFDTFVESVPVIADSSPRALQAQPRPPATPRSGTGPPARRPPASSALGTLALSMPVGWAELVTGNIENVIARGGASGSMIPFCNSMPWNPVSFKVHIVGSDHHNYDNLPSYYNVWDDATNLWAIVTRTDKGSHGYQLTSVNPHTGDVYLCSSYGGGGYTDSLYKFNPQTTTFDLVGKLADYANIYNALIWWQGRFDGAGAQGCLIHYTGNFSIINCYDPLTNKVFYTSGQLIAGHNGTYQVESAYSKKKNCAVLGGGNGYNLPAIPTLVRLNADRSITPMPDAPHPIGVHNGMNLVSDSTSGNFLALGFGEMWELNPDGAGTWTKLGNPPADLAQPPGGSLVSVDCSTYGVILYIDALYSRTPVARMRLYRHAP